MGTNWWNGALLRELFTDEEVALVLSMPVSNIGQGDAQVLRGTKNGLFSIKSAYFIQKEIDEQGATECATIIQYGEISGNSSFQMWRKNFCGGLAMRFFPLK